MENAKWTKRLFNLKLIAEYLKEIEDIINEIKINIKIQN